METSKKRIQSGWTLKGKNLTKLDPFWKWALL